MSQILVDEWLDMKTDAPAQIISVSSIIWGTSVLCLFSDADDFIKRVYILSGLLCSLWSASNSTIYNLEESQEIKKL